RDLVGVFDQLLGLLRDLLLLKTAGHDVSAMLSPTYTESQLRAVGEGLSASTLLAYSKVVQDSIARIKAESNRRVEAELCIVSMCTMLEDSYDSLTGRVEALEEKMRHGVPIAAVSAPVQKQDTPAWESEEKFDEKPKERTEKQKKRPSNDWAAWMNVVERARTRINIGAFTCLQMSSRAELDDDILRVYCENDVVVKLAKEDKTLAVLTELVQGELGKPVRLRFYGPDDAPQKGKRSAGLGEILDKAKAFDIDITEF
ncbi:MAG: DNA polymerase III subunit gamma/tau, partial [Butyricicoccus sp.]|nr:DNA polymerase III subunit gamma/tau [Butyricicoccus sp.]